jgi:7-keto-8-aminopelargonate synthetase-like enzyme
VYGPNGAIGINRSGYPDHKLKTERQMIILNSGIGNYIWSDGKKYLYFGGNNYLGLANHPELIEASVKILQEYGVNFSASRRTTGTADIHLKLEKQLSDFKGKEDSVIFPSGYQGNGILLEILKTRYTSVYADQFSHSSITAGIPRDIITVRHYNHCDADHLEFLLDKEKNDRPLIITDGVFALTGEIAPLDKIYYLVKKFNAILVVDDAHSTGILGRTGKGTPEYFNLPESDKIFQTETMSKALGSYGGFISGSKKLTNVIREQSAI